MWFTYFTSKTFETKLDFRGATVWPLMPTQHSKAPLFSGYSDPSKVFLGPTIELLIPGLYELKGSGIQTEVG